MTNALTPNSLRTQLWRILLVLAILTASLIRHINLLSSMWPYLIWFSLGLVVGALMHQIDRLFLYRWYQDKAVTTTKLITESTLFTLCLVPVSLFVVTSSGSALGAGLILGLWVSLVSDLVTAPDYLTIQSRYLYQLKKPLTEVQTKWLTRILFGWLLLLTLWVLF